MRLVPMDPKDEKAFDKIHPSHAGHKKLCLPQSGLGLVAFCDWCQTTLKVSLAALMVAQCDDPDKTPPMGIEIAIEPEKDDRFPHECPRCKGPAYWGGNNNVDCKRKCS